MAQARTDQSLVRLNESISLLERQMEEGRKAIEQVLHAEITSRYKITPVVCVSHYIKECTCEVWLTYD